tara:strand:- start:675 stop:1532 length:858 start_codon:yes stop_codon:yes gene_type:complete
MEQNIQDIRLKLESSKIHYGKNPLSKLNNSKFPLVSVCTVVKNNKNGLVKAIKSLINQDYKNIEYIVIDGASSDGTTDVIKKYEKYIDIWVSEKDEGTPEACNKGITLSNGTYFVWLASDDWYESDFISEAVASLKEKDLDFVVGQSIMYRKETGEKIFATTKPNKSFKDIINQAGSFNYGQIVNHKRCFEKIGILDDSFKFVNDLDWLIRLYRSIKPKAEYNHKMKINRTAEGLASNYFKQSRLEILAVLKKHNLPIRRMIFSEMKSIIIVKLGKIKRILTEWK